MRSTSLVLTAALVLSLPSIPAARQPPPLSKIDRQRGQDMLRQVREDIEKNYFDPTFKRIDMAAQFSTAEQRITKATTLNEMYAVLTDAVTALDDSHTVFLPPSRAARVDYGWRMAMVGDVPLVVSVSEGSDAAAKGMTRGDRVVSLNRFKPERTNRALRPSSASCCASRTAASWSWMSLQRSQTSDSSSYPTLLSKRSDPRMR